MKLKNIVQEITQIEENFKDVSNKFKNALDVMPEKYFNKKGVLALIKKLKEKNPEAAMAYTMDAFGWMKGMKESMDTVGKEDGDIDNDGDEDSSDEYLAKKRNAISKAIKNETKLTKIAEAAPKMKVYSWEKDFNEAQKNLDRAANIMSMKSSGGYNNVKKDVMKVQKALNMLRSKMKSNSTEF